VADQAAKHLTATQKDTFLKHSGTINAVSTNNSIRDLRRIARVSL